MLSSYFFSIILCISASAAVPLAQSLQWGKCPSIDPSPAGLSCAELKVPINWEEPNGEQISIFMARQAAKHPKAKIGSLIFNPGGPGISAADIIIGLAQYNVSLFPDEFDVIGPDPRGVGQSHPVSCDPALWNQRVKYQPTDEGNFQQLVAYNEAVGASCRNLTGPLLGYLDSLSVARDFDAIRAAMQEDKLSYLGLSYGTVIGQAYAHLFPDNIRAMALDGNLDHSLSETSSLATEVYTYENVFLRFATWCETTPSCALHGTDVPSFFLNLTTRADRSPIPAPGCDQIKTCRSNVTGQEIRFNFQDDLYFKNGISFDRGTGWSIAALALKQAGEGNATLLSTPIAVMANGSAITTNGIAQVCLDWNHTASTFSDLKYKAQMTGDIAPYTQGASQQYQIQGGCIGWPVTVKWYPGTLNITNTPTILLTNAYHDPATSYVAANGLMDQIQNAVLVTRDGDGHTSYFLGGQSYETINTYLVTLKTPPPNTVLQS